MPDFESIQLPIVYTSDDGPMLFANHFAIQYHQGDFILTLGQVQPPLLLGTAEEQKAQASRLTHVPVRSLVRAGMSRARLIELRDLLTDHLNRFDPQEGS